MIKKRNGGLQACQGCNLYVPSSRGQLDVAMHDKAHTIAGKGDFTRSRGTSFRARGVRQDVGRVRIHSLFCNRAKPGQHTIFTGRTCFHACTRAPKQASPRASGITTTSDVTKQLNAHVRPRHVVGSHIKARRRTEDNMHVKTYSLSHTWIHPVF